MEKSLQKMKAEMQLRGLSKKTKEEYLFKINLFQNHYKKPASQISEDEIKKFILYLLNEKKHSASTINTYYAALKFLYRKTLKQNWNEEEIPRMKKSRKLPSILSKEEVHSVFNATNNIKHKCILMTVYGSGLRLGEVANLKVSDIDSKGMRIFIRRGKGDKDRYAILSETNLTVLRDYWKIFRTRDWLFEGKTKGMHISKRAVQDLFKLAAKKAGINKSVSIHTLRHCFATHLLEANVNLFHIKQLLGHSDIKTTTSYLQLVNLKTLNLKSPLDTIGGQTNA
jgi:site-specific recombinase XerD